MTNFLVGLALGATIFLPAGFVMGSMRVRAADPEALSRFASKSSENAARSVG